MIPVAVVPALALGWLAFGPFLPLAPATPAAAPAARDAQAIHRDAIVVDTHADTTQQIVYRGGSFLDGIPGAHLDLPRMRAGGVDAQFFSIFVHPRRFAPPAHFAEAQRQVDGIRALVAESGGRLALCRTAAEVRASAARGVPAVLLGVEGGHALGPGSEAEQLARLGQLAAAGVRYLTLTWTNSNDFGGSSGDAGRARGLSERGRRLVDEMHRLGVVVDLSHVSDALFWDVVRYTRRPVILSHSSARALADVPRNVDDAMLRAVAAGKGAVCVNFNPSFLDAGYARRQRPLWGKFRHLPADEGWRQVMAESAKLAPVPLSRLADHVMHMVAVAGVDAVCLGSDFDGIPATPAGLEDAGHLQALTVELARRGLGPDDLRKILGANTLRVLEANEP